jgi:hypothetical protein
MAIHKNYELLTAEEKTIVDEWIFSKSLFRRAFDEFGIRLSGDDSVERAVEAVATWIIESRK